MQQRFRGRNHWWRGGRNHWGSRPKIYDATTPRGAGARAHPEADEKPPETDGSGDDIEQLGLVVW